MNRGGKKRLCVLLILDALMIIMEIHALNISRMESGWKLFRYYTQNSNILVLAACLFCAAKEITCLFKDAKLPRWTRKLRYYAACCLALTLVIAGFFLAPTDPDLGFAGFMLEGKYLYLHTICPIMGMALFFLHPGMCFREKHALKALLPTLVYGAISLCLNAVGAYSGPYPFLRVREQAGYVTAVGCIAVLGVNYALSRSLAALSCIRRKTAK